MNIRSPEVAGYRPCTRSNWQSEPYGTASVLAKQKLSISRLVVSKSNANFNAAFYPYILLPLHMDYVFKPHQSVSLTEEHMFCMRYCWKDTYLCVCVCVCDLASLIQKYKHQARYKNNYLLKISISSTCFGR